MTTTRTTTTTKKKKTIKNDQKTRIDISARIHLDGQSAHEKLLITKY